MDSEHIFNNYYKLINLIFTCLYDKLILCHHLFIQIFADSTPFQKDEARNVQELIKENLILKLIEASAESS